MGNPNSRRTKSASPKPTTSKSSTVPNKTSQSQTVTRSNTPINVPIEPFPAPLASSSPSGSLTGSGLTKAVPQNLRFQSLKTGTFVTPAFDTEISISTDLKTVDIKRYKAKKLSGMAAIFISQMDTGNPSKITRFPISSAKDTPELLKIKELIKSMSQIGGKNSGSLKLFTSSQAPGARTYLRRADKNKKDIIITSSSITHNIVRITERHLPNGYLSETPGDEYKHLTYNVADVISTFQVAQRKEFWNNNWVEVDVELSAFTRISDDKGRGKEVRICDQIIAQMETLGPDFLKYTKTLFVVIHLPAAPASATITKPNAKKKQTRADTRAIRASFEYHQLEMLVPKLREFTGLSKMEVILRAPSSNQHLINLHHVYHALPFYDLEYQDWQLRFQPENVTGYTMPVSGFPLAWLDAERDKLLFEQDQLSKKRQEETVFVRKSAAPPSCLPRVR